MVQGNADLRSLRGYSLTLPRRFAAGRGRRWVSLGSTYGLVYRSMPTTDNYSIARMLATWGAWRGSRRSRKRGSGT